MRWNLFWDFSGFFRDVSCFWGAFSRLEVPECYEYPAWTSIDDILNGETLLYPHNRNSTSIAT
jgi:hypothetical protein